MAQISIAITKRVAFRDAVQEFSNVYTYFVAVSPNGAEATNRINELVTLERTFHSTLVTFVRGKCWSSGGNISDNQMIAEVTLSGTGSSTANVSMDKERAFLIQWPAGFDSRGKPVYLRKWYHACGQIAAVAVTTDQLANNTGLTSANRTAIANAVEPVRFIGGLDEYMLCSDAGRQTTAGAICHPYLEHHQLGDQWRDG